jgi:type II secretory pathway pseudopilin PulG
VRETRTIGDRHRRRPRDSGVILMALLLGLALGGIALMAAVDVWWMTRQREREQQLLFVGNQYRLAIRRYYYGAPAGTPRVLPPSLESLLEDDRYPMPVRYLRRMYPDPITGKPEWGTLLDGGDRITGVYSLSDAQPVKQTGFAPADKAFNGMAKYRDWVFAFSIPRRGGAAPPPTVAAPRSGAPSFPGSPVRGKQP